MHDPVEGERHAKAVLIAEQEPKDHIGQGFAIPH
jgi:hypothetical protein